jgi:hypothetical protein
MMYCSAPPFGASSRLLRLLFGALSSAAGSADAWSRFYPGFKRLYFSATVSSSVMISATVRASNSM